MIKNKTIVEAHNLLKNSKVMATVHPLPEAKTAGKIMAPSSPGSTTFPSSNTVNINNSNSGEVYWYFAIGSMMNPLSMKNRSIVPLTSVPGELFDYELVFTGGMGFAEAIPCPGSSFHGVLVSGIHSVD